MSENAATIELISAEMAKVNRELIARVPEELFIRDMLPIMAGEEGHNSLEPWVELTGTIFNKAVVVDRNDNVLFEVPPIGVSPNFDSDRENRASLYEVMEHHKLLMQVQPLAARNYLDSKLSELISKRPRDFDTLRKVDEILERYGKKPRIPKDFYERLDQGKTGDGAAATTTVTQMESDIGDDL